VTPKEKRVILRVATGLQLRNVLVQDLIACGDYGCAFYTNVPDIVVKIGAQWSEYNFARAIIERNLERPGLPKIHGVVDLRETGVPYYAIIRADIPSLPPEVDNEWLDEALADLEYQLEDISKSEEIIEKAVEILEARPGSAADELLFEQVVDLTAWCYDRGILLGDMLVSNFGQLQPGTITLRDLGGARIEPLLQ